MKVFVYYNLHKGCFSVKALEGENRGRVIAHRDIVPLTDAKFKVSPAGRARVLREQRKNVHAGVVGRWSMGWVHLRDQEVVRVTYNPYVYSSFVNAETKEPVHHASRVLLQHGCIWAVL
jgi:hypothetical protein